MIDELAKEIEGARRSFLHELEHVQSPEKLAALKERYLGRKSGIIGRYLARLKGVTPAEKPVVGQEINRLKAFVEEALAGARDALCASGRPQWQDHSLPASDLPVGGFHLIAAIQRQIEELFLNMGYEIAYGPEAELEDYNFTKLNIPEFHPARDEQDTFFLEGFDDLVLRTHTSPMQVRYMLDHRPPFKIISPGKAFRKDDPDATHSPCFHQVEGLLVDRGIHFSHLRGTLEAFCRSFYGSGIVLRFRPGYFPFTEPSAEVDISCFLCGSPAGSRAQGQSGSSPAGSSAAGAASRLDPDCRVCKGSGWLEILGSGMVHPKVLANCGIDPEEYSGFAFGMGIERVAMVKYGVPDLRLLYENDLRLLGQFG
ncbi:MAG: phenylalanine--tRNA ligase subunit alpha [Candidatus Aminicenantes bacterium]|nr:phenylalanine--tRNA ligase subunit alpha [Candidatus Aminicenantes bacterium]